MVGSAHTRSISVCAESAASGGDRKGRPYFLDPESVL